MNMSQILEKQIHDLRGSIMNFNVMGHKVNYGAKKKKEPTLEEPPSHVDILLFGPAGSGKSSLIKTFYRSLHN